MKNVFNQANSLDALSQAKKERLLFIDFNLYFLGRLNRTDIVSRFGIKEAAASRDLSLYKELAPKNLDYSTSIRAYLKCDSFKPLFIHIGTHALSALLHGFSDDTVKSLIPCEAPTHLNFINMDILAAITRAIHNTQVLSISYHSLSSGESTREIVPFALVDNGLRFHVRAFDRKTNRFADFVINRMDVIACIEDNEIPDKQKITADNQWNRIVDLHIVPHPSLKHPETIELEYGMANGTLKVQVRAAVAGYVLKRWNVDCSENHLLKNPEIHLWLENKQTLYGVDNLSIAPGYLDENSYENITE